MSALDGIIKWKQLEAAEKETNRQSVMDIFGTFQKARQTSTLLDMEKKKVDAGLAKSGLRFGESGKIEADESLLDTLGVGKEWKPTTQEEALSYERAKVDIKKPIVSKETKSALGSLTKAINEGTLTNAAQAKQFIDEAEPYFNSIGADVEEIRRVAQESLPTSTTPGSKGFLGMGKRLEQRVKGGKTYEKRSDDLWHLITK